MGGIQEVTTCSLCQVYALFLTGHILSLKHEKNRHFPFLIGSIEKEKSGGPFYSIYEKERVMSSAMVHNL